jgi:hypothetical protein
MKIVIETPLETLLLYLRHLIMTNETSVTAGWEIINTEVIDGTYLVTVKTTSCSPINSVSGESHRIIRTSELFTFDHEPSDEEIEVQLQERGFNPELEKAVSENKMIVETEGDQVLGYDYINDENDYIAIMDLVPISIEENPFQVTIKGNWIYLYYISVPDQFFDIEQEHILYSVRIHKETGEVRRKGYNFNLTIDSSVTNSLEDFNEVNHIIGTGHFYDEDKVTIYHTAEARAAGVPNPLLNGSIPFYGITWENNSKLHTRYYHKGNE